jgi:hypothetical protein
MDFELIQPWSTFVMKTQLSSPVLEKMLNITDKIIENRAPDYDPGGGQMIGQYHIRKTKIDSYKKIEEYFLEACKNYIIQAWQQARPDRKENEIQKDYQIKIDPQRQIVDMWINSQKDNEYFPAHMHAIEKSHLSAVMYLKIPEYLPSRKPIRDNDGKLVFISNCSKDNIWGNSYIELAPSVGDFFIFPSSQIHQVYPFRTADGKGERRSISFNAQIFGYPLL